MPVIFLCTRVRLMRCAFACAFAFELCFLRSSPFALLLGNERIFWEHLMLRSVAKSQRMHAFDFWRTSQPNQRILCALRHKIWTTRVRFLTYSLIHIEFHLVFLLLSLKRNGEKFVWFNLRNLLFFIWKIYYQRFDTHYIIIADYEVWCLN